MLTVENFIETFKERHHWNCNPGSRIHADLTRFAEERLGSTRNKEELYVIFCLAHDLTPYPAMQRPDNT